MRKTKIHALALLPILLFCSSLNAQKLWTLDECLTYALEHNLSLKQNELAVRDAENTLLQAKMRRLPSLNGSASNVYNFGRSIDPLTNANVQRNSANWRFGLSSGLVLFNGFQIQNSIQQQRNMVYASRFDEEVAKNDIGMSLANAYLQVLFAKELVKINTEQKKSTALQLERAEKFYEAGRVAESAVLEMKAQLANDHLNLVNATNQEWMARVTLFQMLMLSPDSNDVAVPEISEVPDAGVVSAGHLLSLYQEKAPELKAAESRVNASQYGWKVAQGAYSPQLAISANLGTIYSDQALMPVYGPTLFYQQYYDANGVPIAQVPLPNVTGTQTTPFGDQMNNNFGQTVALSLTIPIFNNYQTKGGVRRAEINYQNTVLAKQITWNTVERNVTQAFNEYLSAKARYEASKASKEAQEASFAYAQKRYDEKLISPVEYNLVLNNLISARSNFIQAKYELMFRYKIIDFYKNGTVYNEVH
ncbi:MAG: TolC family protein [Bacteroidota bacterium]|nr:TolC family protein [Bacteroidota bacterium]MDX5430812.1 TolC family protein [Bacteroidota bacterium]MDX5469558.1 TolC family protein [Bacteroidota bacterium]